MGELIIRFDASTARGGMQQLHPVELQAGEKNLLIHSTFR